MRSKLLITLTAAGTAGAAYFLDPDQGKRRRNMARDRATAFFRQGAQKTEQSSRAGASYAKGMVERTKAAVRKEQPPSDDLTLKNKVETELFRPADAPKGEVNVEVVDGVVTLRGQLESSEQIEELEAKARKITGVSDVKNLLHTPDTPAPNVAALQDAP
jgi:osmotically-inducible protein OsmY